MRSFKAMKRKSGSLSVSFIRRLATVEEVGFAGIFVAILEADHEASRAWGWSFAVMMMARPRSLGPSASKQTLIMVACLRWMQINGGMEQ